MPTLKQFREEAALTQPELGQLCGVTKQTIWGWETGVVSPRPPHIRKLAEVLGKSVAEIRQAVQATKEEASKETLPNVACPTREVTLGTWPGR